MKNLLYILLLMSVSLFFNCSNKDIDMRLTKAENYIELKPDSSYLILKEFKPQNIKSQSQRAKWALLFTISQFKTGNFPNNDSIINIACNYYDKGEYGFKSLIFKGGVCLILGNRHQAIEYYKKAEQMIPKDDYKNLGYINLRIGDAYIGTYILNNEHIRRVKQAMNYYEKINDLKYIEKCAGILGALYRDYKNDSAYYYLNYAIGLSAKLADSTSYYLNQEMLVKLYYLDNRFKEAKNLGRNIIEKGYNYIDLHELNQEVCRAYAALGMTDSANYYFKKVDSNNLEGTDKIYWLNTKHLLLEAEHKYKESLDCYKEYSKLAHIIHSKSRMEQLYSADKEFDKKIVENEKIKVERYVMLLSFICLIFILLAFLLWNISRKRKYKLLYYEQTMKELQHNYKRTNDDLLHKLNCALNNEYSNIERIERLKYTINSQNQLMQAILDKSMESVTGDMFVKEFNRLVATAKLDDSTWADLRIFIDECYDGMISKIEKNISLSKWELNFIALLCCGFSVLQISVCMGYKNSRSAYNLKKLISSKMKLDIPLEVYLKNMMNN